MRDFIFNKIFFLIVCSTISIIIYKHYIINYKYSEIFTNYNESLNYTSQPDIILFGSSIENHFDYASSSRYRISEILDTLTDKKVKHISNPGFYMPVYYSFIKSLSKNNFKKPVTLIVPINMRSFSNTWYGSKYNQFRDIDLALSFQSLMDKEYINSYENQKINSNCNTDIDFKEFMSMFFLSENDNIIEKCIYYNFIIKPNNYVLVFLNKILETKVTNLKIYFYFVPLDYSKLSNGEKNILAKNINFIKKIMDEKNTEYIDLSKSFNSELFDYTKTFNEHTKQYGKFLTAKYVRDSLL